jgi:hypothetical protein
MTTIRTFAALALVLAVYLAASVAYASAFTITVRITDHSEVERHVGTCDSGYYVLGMVDGRPRSYAFRDGIATIPVRTTAHTFPHIELACNGVDRGMPATGVDISMH